MSKQHNVFISWSGERSRKAALALKEWLPMVVYAAEPWMSDLDIDKGSRGLSEIATALGVIKIGIVCLTPENQDSRWLNYEAGALSKSIDEKTRVYTYLLSGLTPDQIKQPLGIFQHTRAEKEDTRTLVKSINLAVNEEPIPETRLDTLFENLWPNLHKSLSAIPETVGRTVEKRAVEEMVAELLDLVRIDGARRGKDQDVSAKVLSMAFEDLKMQNSRLVHDLARGRELEMEIAHLQIDRELLKEQLEKAASLRKLNRTYRVWRQDGPDPITVKASGVREDGPGNFVFIHESGEERRMEGVTGIVELALAR